METLDGVSSPGWRVRGPPSCLPPAPCPPGGRCLLLPETDPGEAPPHTLEEAGMRSVGRIIVVLSAIVALGVGMTPVNASAATLGVEAFGAYNTYAMDDVNTFIGQAN